LALQRLKLYRGNLSATWDKVLAAAYPVLRQLVGDEFFGGLARAYGKAYPSDSGDLNRFGAHFSAFLRDFPHVAQYSYFPDMAVLEWAMHRAHYADAIVALTKNDIAPLSPEQLDTVRFTLHPACCLLASDWAVFDIWQAHQGDGEKSLPEELRKQTWCVVARPVWKAELLQLSNGAFAALSALQQGASLGAALDAALELDPEFDFGFHLQQWLQYALLGSIRLSDPSTEE
jgi:hypothetical protein